MFDGFFRQVFGVGGEDARRAFDQDHARLGGIDVAEVVAHVELGDVADGAGKFDAGGPSADDDEVQFGVGAGLYHFALGQFKGEQDAAANFGCVLDGFEAGRELGPVVFAEVGVGGAGAQDEVVVFDHGAAVQKHAVVVGFDGRRLRPSALRYFCFWKRWSGWAGRCLPGKARPALPGRAGAGKCGDCGGRSGSRRPPCLPAPCPAFRPAKPPPTTTTRGRLRTF